MSKKTIAILAVLALLLIYLILCIVSPSTYSYKDEVKITGPYKMVYVIVNDVTEWPKWYSWKKSDPDLQVSLGGRQMHVGANFTFDSDILGKGYTEITEAFQDSFITAKIKSSKIPNELKISWRVIPEGKKIVYVNFNARLVGMIPFIKRGYYFGFQNKLDKTFDQDLDGIKTYIEELVKGEFGIEKVVFPGQKYFGKLDVIQSANIPRYYAKYLPLAYRILDSLNIEITGNPVGLIYDWEASTGLVAIMAALPINVKTEHIPGWSFEEIQQRECLKLINYGSYKTLTNAHAKLNYSLDNSPFTLDIPMIEEYVTSPSQEPDTSKWQTNIYYLLENRGAYAQSVKRQWTLEDVIREQEEDRKAELINQLREFKRN